MERTRALHRKTHRLQVSYPALVGGCWLESEAMRPTVPVYLETEGSQELGGGFVPRLDVETSTMVVVRDLNVPVTLCLDRHPLADLSQTDFSLQGYRGISR